MTRISLLFVSFILLTIHSFAQEKPNIIYILCDDMGYGDLSSYGQKNFSTPNIDKLAESGIKFTQHYAGSPVCAPSRATLMTGRDPGHSRVRGNYETGPSGFGAGLELKNEDVTLAEVAKMAGYQTALIGKWGMGMPSTSGAPEKQGFDFMYGFLNQAHAHYQFPDYLYRNGKKEYIKVNRDEKKGAYSNDIFTREALSYLKMQKKDQPFFLYLAYVTPHAELIVPEDNLFNSFKGKFKEAPFASGKQGSNGKNSFGAYASQNYPAAAYASMVVRIDQDVAKLKKQLILLGLDENTIIMFSSDNGSHKEGGANPAVHNSNGGLRGAKRDVYEGGIRVPFIVNWPAKIKGGQTSGHISAFWDIMPTLAEITGIDLKEKGIPTEGISLMPIFNGTPDQQKKHPYLYWEFHENKTSDQAIRVDDWKAIRHDPAGKTQLYNLKNDVTENNDVAAQHPLIVAKMEEMMNSARIPHDLWPLKSSNSSK
ncbi:MAG: arylsulfatase [Daejeonella sp.]